VRMHIMKEITSDISSTAIMILCTSTGSLCKCRIAKYSSSAGSYCSEILVLGTILTQLILKAAVHGCMGPYPIITEDCNNEDIVKHGNMLNHQVLMVLRPLLKLWAIRNGFQVLLGISW
jgi:hypothetical protein